MKKPRIASRRAASSGPCRRASGARSCGCTRPECPDCSQALALAEALQG